MPALNSAILLPCGSSIKNRLAKAAMTEGMATAAGLPTPELIRLYSIWAKGGAGLLISGNIQIDRDHLERPGNVIIDAKDGRMASKKERRKEGFQERKEGYRERKEVEAVRAKSGIL